MRQRLKFFVRFVGHMEIYEIIFFSSTISWSQAISDEYMVENEEEDRVKKEEKL